MAKHSKTISAKIGNYTFEPRNIKVYESMSDETLAMEADVYIDGVHCADVSNSGRGEGKYPHPFPEHKAKYDIVEKEIGNYHYTPEDKKYGSFEWDYDIDFLIGMTVDKAWYDGATTYKF